MDTFENSTPIFAYTLVEHIDLSSQRQPTFDGTNPDNAPRFVEQPEAADVGNLRLRNGSPAVDAGLDEQCKGSLRMFSLRRIGAADVLASWQKSNTLLPGSWTEMKEGIDFTIEPTSDDGNQRSGVLQLISSPEGSTFYRQAFSSSE